jgi:hypothetical protein
MTTEATPKDKKPQPNLASSYRVTLASLVGLLVVGYTLGVVLGHVPKDNRIDTGGLGIIVVGIIGAVLLFAPEALDRLTLLRLPGIEIALAEVKANQAKQKNDLEDISLILALVLPDTERKHLLNLADAKTSGYTGSHAVRTELRRLRSIGLVRMRDGHHVSEMENGLKFDLATYVVLTDLGDRLVRRIRQVADAEARDGA